MSDGVDLTEDTTFVDEDWYAADLAAARLSRTHLDLAGAVLLAERHGAIVGA